MVTMREVLVFTKDVNGGIASLLDQLSRLEFEDIQFKLFLYRKSNIHVFGGKIQYISKYYPANLSFSVDKLYFFILNVIRTYILLKKYPKNTKLFACDMYSALILLLLKTFFRGKIHVICLVNSNFQKIISQKSNPLYRLLLEWIVKYLYRYADHIIYVSHELAVASNSFLNVSQKKSVVIPNGISREIVKTKMNTMLEDADLKKMREDTSFKIISVGRLVPQKDFFTLITAFAEVNKKYENSSLYIIGDGVLRPELEKLCRRLNLMKKIHFLGWKDNVHPFYKEVDIFVLATHYEGFGRVILEAMASGTPVISSDVDFGPAEILNNGEFGLLTEEGNVQMMSDQILQLIFNKSKRKKLAQLAYQRVDDFPEKTMLEYYKKIFMS